MHVALYTPAVHVAICRGLSCFGVARNVYFDQLASNFEAIHVEGVKNC